MFKVIEMDGGFWGVFPRAAFITLGHGTEGIMNESKTIKVPVIPERPCPVCGVSPVIEEGCINCGGRKGHVDHKGHPWLGLEIFDECICNSI